MADNVKKISDFRQYEDSPFTLYGMSMKTVTRKGKSATMVSGEGDAITFVEPGQEQVVLHDEEQYIKVFKYGLDTIKHLNSRALCLIMYIMNEMAPRKNTVDITRARVAKFSPKLAGASYYIALSELLDLGVIARSKSKKIFYVNPNVMFNGDRRGIYKKTTTTNEEDGVVRSDNS